MTIKDVIQDSPRCNHEIHHLHKAPKLDFVFWFIQTCCNSIFFNFFSSFLLPQSLEHL
ncbi:hypothetical protein HanRHA438_Chr06g0277171 [Helianthus annuus]|nr:hypothetical protein HanRHA438_Chr06g0277171 [Helianthus annuus]